jgi:hypothetical protein
MSIKIDIEGLDKLKRQLDEMEQGLKIDTIECWCKRIVNDVKLNSATESGERLVMEAVPKADGNMEIKFSSPKELIRLVVDKTKQYMPEMPLTTRVFFGKFVEVIEEKDKEGG